MLFAKGDAVIHELSGLTGKIESRGHYPDTVIIALDPAKAGELPRNTEVYFRHLIRNIPATP
jgi:hypothetical protein